MRFFYPVKSLVVSRNLWLILLNKILLILNLVKHTSKIYNYKDFKSVQIVSVALVAVEFLAILWFFTKLKLQIYLRPMLPPGGKNWQLISPHKKVGCFACEHCTSFEYYCKKVLKWWAWMGVRWCNLLLERLQTCSLRVSQKRYFLVKSFVC